MTATTRINFTADREATIAELIRECEIDRETAEQIYDGAVARVRAYADTKH